jgi:hypothetical protein
VGAWGDGIKQDDTVLDVIGDFDEYVRSGVPPHEATQKVLQKWSGVDPDEQASLWIGLAESQWQYGVATPETIARIARFASGEGQHLWKEQGDKVYERRLKKLEAFHSKLREPNPRPRRPKKLIVRRAKFETGSCLAIRCHDGNYIAALVVGINEQNPEYGQTIVLVLDYYSATLPAINDFQLAPPLRLNFGQWGGAIHVAHCGPQGFNKIRADINVIGKVEVPGRFRSLDVRTYASWQNLADIAVLQHESTRGMH